MTEIFMFSLAIIGIAVSVGTCVYFAKLFTKNMQEAMEKVMAKSLTEYQEARNLPQMRKDEMAVKKDLQIAREIVENQYEEI